MPFLHTKKSNLCRAAVEDLIEPGKEGDGGDGGGQNVADRLGQKHAEHCIRQNMRQNDENLLRYLRLYLILPGSTLCIYV